MASQVDRENDGLRPSEPVPLRGEHLPQALELSRALRWPYRLEDWQFALALGRGFAVEMGGRLVGTALWWPYGNRYASAGMIIVAPDAQRKGIGGALMDALLADAAGRTIILNSTKDGYPLYARLGFEPHGHVHQHQAILTEAPSAEARDAVRALRAADLGSVYALDAAATGMDRSALLDALLAMADTKVVERDGRISGYGCLRRWGRGVVIGPVVAEDGDDSRALIAALAASHAGEFVRIDVPAASGLSPWLEAAGLLRVDSVVAMALGERPAQETKATLFALSNQSLG